MGEWREEALKRAREQVLAAHARKAAAERSIVRWEREVRLQEEWIEEARGRIPEDRGPGTTKEEGDG